MGEVHINNEDLVDFIEMAEQFKIRGVTKEQTVCIEISASRHIRDHTVTIPNDNRDPIHGVMM